MPAKSIPQMWDEHLQKYRIQELMSKALERLSISPDLQDYAANRISSSRVVGEIEPSFG